MNDDETRYPLTLEGEIPDDGTYVPGIRHLSCVERTDCDTRAIPQRTVTPTEINRDPYDRTQVFYGYECWGCDGWLDEPPLTVEATAALHKAREQ